MRSELDLIDAFLAPFGLDRSSSSAEGVLAGPGDDCAVVRPSRGFSLVVKTDAVVEGVHFRMPPFTPEDVGHKALAVNLSDLAAAGARPRWFVCALGVPKTGSATSIARRMGRGMAHLAQRHGCGLVGGNVTRAPGWSVTLCVFGEAKRPRGRTGARAGDALVMVGTLGAAAKGLADLRKGARTAAARAQLRPEPLVEQGLAAGRFASAAIDVSDGFLRDLGHLCESSGCGAEVDGGALPVAPGASFDDALSGGEDYALLFAARPRQVRQLVAHVPGARPVGRFVAEPGIRLLQDGRPRRLPSRLGFDHLE
ncbi:MAG: thiamine-phosphate kinase [Myxococcales bacterium]